MPILQLYLHSTSPERRPLSQTRKLQVITTTTTTTIAAVSKPLFTNALETSAFHTLPLRNLMMTLRIEG